MIEGRGSAPRHERRRTLGRVIQPKPSVKTFPHSDILDPLSPAVGLRERCAGKAGRFQRRRLRGISPASTSEFTHLRDSCLPFASMHRRMPVLPIGWAEQ